MNESQQPESSRIEKLIALKRFECPPPGHAELLSSKIISHLEAEQMRARKPWFQRLMHSLDLNPILTTAYGCVVMALLLVGWNYGEHFEADAPSKGFGKAGLQVSAMGLMGNGDFHEPNMLLESINFGQHSIGSQSTSSLQPSGLQPDVHIPGSPVRWLRDPMAVPKVSDSEL